VISVSASRPPFQSGFGDREWSVCRRLPLVASVSKGSLVLF